MYLSSFSCPSNEADEAFILAHKMNRPFDEIYKTAESIADFALKVKENCGREYCFLPFCHTVEAEGLGGKIVLGDESGGARGAGFVFDSFEQLANANINYNNKSRLPKMLDACALLKAQNEKVIYSLSGPFSIINCLIDAKVFFKVWRKNETLIKKYFEQLVEQLGIYSEKIFGAGADIISYADPAGSFDILGPKYSEYVSENFTVPLLKNLSEKCDETQAIFICPVATRALLKSDSICVGNYMDSNIYVACSKIPNEQKVAVRFKQKNI